MFCANFFLQAYQMTKSAGRHGSGKDLDFTLSDANGEVPFRVALTVAINPLPVSQQITSLPACEANDRESNS